MGEIRRRSTQKRLNPINLLTNLMQEQVEIWEDEALDREMRRQAQKSRYTEDDAVELVRQYRREKRELATS